MTGPQQFDEAALRLGYRLLALSDLNTPAVFRVCVGAVLRAESDFASRMRQHRVLRRTSDPLGGRPP